MVPPPVHGAHWPKTMAKDFRLILRFTRHWIHYGFIAHVTICVLVAAVEGILSRR